MKRGVGVVVVSFLMFLSAAWGSEAPLIGDWDLGPGTVVFQVLASPDSDSTLLVRYCKRKVMLERRVCRYDIELPFVDTDGSGIYRYEETGGSHFRGSIQIDPAAGDASRILYVHESSWNSGKISGTRL